MRYPEYAIETSAGDADLPAGVSGDVTKGLEACGIGGERRHQHPAIGIPDDLVEAGADAELRSRGGLLKDVGGIANQGEHAVIANRSKLRLGAGIAELRTIVEFPVAGMENPSERRVDQESIALGDGVSERDVPETKGTETKVGEHVLDIELDLPRQPLLLQLAGNESGRERRCI